MEEAGGFSNDRQPMALAGPSMAARSVVAKDGHAANFHRHFGFMPAIRNPLSLFMTREDLSKTVARRP